MAAVVGGVVARESSMGLAVGLLLALAVFSGCAAKRRGGSLEGQLRARRLMVPVAGVTPGEVKDTFAAPRDGGRRRHNAVDIMAPHGTPVVATDDGEVLAVARTALGASVIYTADPNRRFVYFYAHLSGYHPRTVPGQKVRRGDVIGYVGSTGNAKARAPHLHFQVRVYPRDHNWRVGTPVNPARSFTAAGRVIQR